MTKLEVGKEYWIKQKYLEFVNDGNSRPLKFVDGQGSFHWYKEGFEPVEAIPECEKVTIPKEVAEWIEERKEQFSTVFTAFLNLTKREYGVKKWINDNQDTLARAWLDGYEVEEPLGVLLVDMPGPSHWEYAYLYRHPHGVYGVNFTDDHSVVLSSKTAIKITEAEAKEKYPNFKWVSLEELDD